MIRLRRARLPDATNKHTRRLEVLNETGYDTRAIRSLVIRALRAQGMRVAGIVRIAHSWRRGHSHHGCAALGTSARYHGLNMVLTVPRDPGAFNLTTFALVVRHEVMHWRGVRHADMTDDQRYCRGPLPAWAAGIEVTHREQAVPTTDERRTKKLAYARAMLKRAQTRAKRAQTLVQRWARRVAAAERALDRGERAMMVHPTQPSENASTAAAADEAGGG